MTQNRLGYILLTRTTQSKDFFLSAVTICKNKVWIMEDTWLSLIMVHCSVARDDNGIDKKWWQGGNNNVDGGEDDGSDNDDGDYYNILFQT